MGLLDHLSHRGRRQPAAPTPSGGIGQLSCVSQVEQKVTVALRQGTGVDGALDHAAEYLHIRACLVADTVRQSFIESLDYDRPRPGLVAPLSES